MSSGDGGEWESVGFDVMCRGSKRGELGVSSPSETLLRDGVLFEWIEKTLWVPREPGGRLLTLFCYGKIAYMANLSARYFSAHSSMGKMAI